VVALMSSGASAVEADEPLSSSSPPQAAIASTAMAAEASSVRGRRERGRAMPRTLLSGILTKQLNFARGRLASVADMGALPILDLAPYVAAPGSDAGRSFVEELRDVVRDVGFFYLAGHGIDPAVPARLHDVARRFFDLPEPDRLAIENVR